MSRSIRQVLVPFLSQLGQALAATVPGFTDPEADLFTDARPPDSSPLDSSTSRPGVDFAGTRPRRGTPAFRRRRSTEARSRSLDASSLPSSHA